MPIYEYQCQACDHQLDALQRINEPPLSDCPACGEAALRKLVSAPGFRLKGSGWYETDFKTGNKRNLAGEGQSSAKSDGSKSATGKSDDKPAAGSGKSDSAKGGKSSAGGDTAT